MIRAWKQLDPVLLVLTLAATALGLFFIFDAGYAHAIQGDKGAWPPEFRTQLAVAIFAIPMGIGMSKLSAGVWLRVSKFAWIVVLLLLVVVLKFGHEVNGAKRWIGLGSASLQPAEFAKLAAILYLSGYLASRKPWIQRLQPIRTTSAWLDQIAVRKLGRFRPAIWICVGIGLIAYEPDLGTAAVIAATAFAMFFPGGVTQKSLVAALCFALVGGALLIKKEPYRWERIINHSHRWEKQNVDDIDYQTIQSELAMASGGVAGVGIGAGRAKHVLPEATTDFIMATVGEEFGLLGSLAVLGILGGLVWRLFVLSQRAPTKFSMLALFGIATWIGVQAAVNFMMANAFLPAIGIPMPFISYGGSSLVALWMAVGITQSLLVPQVAEEEAHAPGIDGWRHGRPHLSRA